MPSPIASEPSIVDERESAAADLIGRRISRKKRKRKRSKNEGELHDQKDGDEDDKLAMSPEEDLTASPPAGLIAGREDNIQQRLTSPPSGSKFVNVHGGNDDFGDTCLEESTIIKNRSEDESSSSSSSAAPSDNEDVDDDADEDETRMDTLSTADHAKVATKIEVNTMDGAASWSSSSDVENFDGKIVYNPDGSAYIIEDSELSDEDAVELDGCIIDGRGVNCSTSEGFPPIANAIYVSSRNQSLHHHQNVFGSSGNSGGGGVSSSTAVTYIKGGASGILPDKRTSNVAEVPVMHSYRVYSVRNNKCEMGRAAPKEDEGAGSPTKDCSSVPVKPILMCFVCKLSFGYAKSFVAHAMSDHNVILLDDEKDILGHKNTSAIIQCVGKEKEPLVSFLEPLSPVIAAPTLRPVVSQLAATTSSILSSISPSSSRLNSDNNSPKVPNSNSPSNNNSNSNAAIRNTIDGCGSLTSSTCASDASDKHVAESLVIHRRISSPLSISSPNVHVPETQPVSFSFRNNGIGAESNLSSFSNTTTINTNATSPCFTTLSSPLSSSCNTGGTTSIAASVSLSTSNNNNNNIRTADGSLDCVLDLTRKSPVSSASSTITPLSSTNIPSPGTSPSPSSTVVSPLLTSGTVSTYATQHPPSFLTGTTIGVCPDHLSGRPSGVDCAKCELILNSSRLGGGVGGGGPLAGMHSRNSCKTLKCPKCNWHYKYQETLEIHMKEKHPETETSCIYCIAGQPHPRLARGETYTCGYKPYRCEVCNYSTTTKGNLSIHMQSDKHLNNMQELQNGTVTNSDLSAAAAAAAVAASHSQNTSPVAQSHSKSTDLSSPTPCSGSGSNGLVSPYHSTLTGAAAAAVQAQKPKPTFRCDVCNYETNVARNLRIHMTSEKHTHNYLVLQQNMKQMQALSAMQQSQHQQQLSLDKLLHFHPALTLPGEKPPPHSEAALADMAYNQALIIQLMTGGQLPAHVTATTPDLSATMDMGLNPETMEPPPEPADPNPEYLFQCCVCNVFASDMLDALSHHLAADRTKIREQEILAIVAGHYVCKLCTYKTTLRANFQLHCKTDKHLQRLQHVNHVKEGGVRNEWKLKYVSSPGGVQVRCNACDYYTNSTHKLQLHAASQRHEFGAALFRYLRDNYEDSGNIYQCLLCDFSCSDKLPLFQHVRSMKHLQIEQIHQLQRRSNGKEPHVEFNEMFKVVSQLNDSIDSDRKNFGYCDKEESPEPRDLPQSNHSSFSEPPQDQAKDLSESNSSSYSDPHQDLPKDLSESNNSSFVETSPLIEHQRNRVNTMSVSEKHVYKYRCNQCSLAFKTAEKLQLHSHYHFIRDATKCVLCSRSFRSILALQKHVESTHSDLSDEEMLLLKQSLLNNPLLLAGLSGKVLDPSITELLKRESMRSGGYDDESMDEECSNRDPEETCAGAGMIHHNNSEDEDDEHVDEFGTSHIPGDENSSDPNRKYTCHKCKEAYPRQQHNYSPLRNKKVPHRKGEKVIYPMEKYLDPNRPYKCEVCKESFTQKNILLVHYNSVSHLHKLKRAAQDMQQSNASSAIVCATNASTATSTSALQQPAFSGSTQLVDAKTPSPSLLSVASDDSFMETPSSQAAAKKSSQIYRTLLESFGFDLVMQFNENHQRRQRREREENERLLAQIQSSTQFTSEEAVAAADSSTSSPISDMRNECTTETPLSTANDKDDATCLIDQLSESSKSTCVHCNKEFSSVWVLKAHCEEVHKDLVPFDFLEQYAQQIKSEIEKKGGTPATSGNLSDREENASSRPDLSLSNIATTKYSEDSVPAAIAITTSSVAVNTADATTCTSSTSSTTTTSSKASCTSLDAFDKDGNCGDDIDDGGSMARNLRETSSTSNPPTACSTPISTTESIPPVNIPAMAAAASASGVIATSNNQSPSSLHQSVAQQMNDMQAALNAMAATQLQFNPMMMSMASLGMGLPLGLNVPALAAMNLQPPLVPMMMPPPAFDPIVSLGQAAAQNPLFSQQNANLDATTLLAKQQQHLLQQQQAASASQQKRARTRITDDQLKILRAHFDINNSPSEEQINKMAAESGLPPKVIKHWFRNTLFKERQRNKDSPYNFNNPPSTTLNIEEYEKTGEAKVMPLTSASSSVAITNADEAVNHMPGNGVDSSPLMKLNVSSNKSVSAIPLKNERTSPHHFTNHAVPLTSSSSFSLPRSIASSPVSVKSEPKETPSSPIAAEHHLQQQSQSGGSLSSTQSQVKFNNLLLTEAEARIKKEEIDDIKSDLFHGREQSPSPPSPNFSEHMSSIPSPCSSPEDLSLSSLTNAQHLNASDLTVGSSNSLLGSSSHSAVSMFPPPKLSQTFNMSGGTSNSTPVNFANRSLSPKRSSSLDSIAQSLLPSGNSNGSCSSSSSSGKRANRTRFTDYQIKVLQEFFENNAYPKDDDLEYLSKLLTLSPRVIVVWFQNARQKARKVYENQPPVEAVGATGASNTSGSVDENSGRFQRTPGLNYQCKKCTLVFQRYYELIRHQKQHCFKEEDAKRSAQAQAAAAQMAAVLSSEDSNSSTIIEQGQQCNIGGGNTSSNPSTPAAPVTPTPAATYPSSPSSQNPPTPESKENTFQCDNCNLVFSRFDLWREHQLIHIMNPNLFPNYPPESPFGILQQQAQQQLQQLNQNQAQPQSQQQQQPQQLTHLTSPSSVSQTPVPHSQQQPSHQQQQQQTHESVYGPINCADSNPSSPHPLAMYNSSKRKYEEYVYLSEDGDSDHPRDKRLRTTILPEQLDYLYQKYQIESNPSRKMLENIANEVGLTKRVVQVWFQNTRARERKGHTRAHTHVINKQCPFCPAMFKVKSALETHLTSKHSDQIGRGGEINLDSLAHNDNNNKTNNIINNNNINNNNNNNNNNNETSQQQQLMAQLQMLQMAGLAIPSAQQLMALAAGKLDGKVPAQFNSEDLSLLQQLYSLGLVAGFPQSFLQNSNALDKLDDRLSRDNRYKKTEANAQEEDEDDWSSDGEPQESDDNNKSQMAAVAAVAAAAAMAAAPPSKSYGSGIGAPSDLYLQTEAAAAAANEALKLTTHR